MRREADFPGEPTTIGELMRTPQTTPTRDEAVLRYYADTFCELGAHHECCGKLNKDECSGCLARSVLASAPAPASGGVDAVAPYPVRVAAACAVLFDGDPTDVAERRDRFAEEALEVVQAFGMSRDDMHALVDYTFGRPVGEPGKEIVAAMTTLTSLANEAGYGFLECAEADLAKLMRPETIERIRAKRATRHGRGPLPGLSPAATPVSEAGGEIPVIPDDDADFTPDLARKIIAGYQRLLLAKPASSPAGGDVRDKLKAAVLRGTADEVNGQPHGNIITKGCKAAEYCDPEDATGAFVDSVVDEVLAALSQSTSAGRVGE